MESTNTIVSKIFIKEDINKAVRSKKILKLRYDKEKTIKGTNVLLDSLHNVMLLLGLDNLKEAKLLIIVESLGEPLSFKGTLPLVVINSIVSDLNFLNVSRQGVSS